MRNDQPLPFPSEANPQSTLRKADAADSDAFSWYLAFALFLVGINLRPALSSVAPVLSAIRDTTGLSATGAALLTTLPVLCFGAFAPLAPRLASRFGTERVVLHGLVVLMAAIGLRVFFGIGGLFAGTLFAGASIGVVMVLLPGILKRDFARQVGGMTGVYTMALCLGAALAAGLTVPLKQFAGDSWRVGLAFWLVPVLLAAVVWWPQTRHAGARNAARRYTVQGLRRDPIAWQVTAYMGLQSTLAYCVFGWLPTVLIDRGLTPLAAGGMLSLSIAMQLITSLAGPWIATRGRDQRAAIALMMIVTLIGFAGCAFADTSWIWFWSVVLGLGQGGCFSIGLTLIVLRAPNAPVAASLSGMAQGLGYSGAALGPLAFGLLHDVSGDWNSAAFFFIAVGIAALFAGLAAGRNLHVKATVTEIA
ncbi:CynX/NimT family MFS transporter [Noviherbaspirillum cavernae]|uniref:CynX/NimT family MFS transporter n=1 Tax=Noviherbaspirillum cavernae TaxID=2320862 RepID=UPI001F5B9FF8|nr:MFS transporter [Noviherbaspirillum cavernae]